MQTGAVTRPFTIAPCNEVAWNHLCALLLPRRYATGYPILPTAQFGRYFQYQIPAYLTYRIQFHLNPTRRSFANVLGPGMSSAQGNDAEILSMDISK